MKSCSISNKSKELNIRSWFAPTNIAENRPPPPPNLQCQSQKVYRRVSRPAHGWGVYRKTMSLMWLWTVGGRLKPPGDGFVSDLIWPSLCLIRKCVIIIILKQQFAMFPFKSKQMQGNKLPYKKMSLLKCYISIPNC